MLRRLIGLSLNHAGMVCALWLILIGWASKRLPSMPVDVFPELNAPTVVVMSEAGGLAADEVEQYVTFPIESAVGGLPGVRRMRSASAISLSIVWIELDWGEDLYRARQLVAERMTMLEGALPPGVHAEIAPVTSIAGEIMLVSLAAKGEGATPIELRAYAEFELRNRLLSIPGISQVVAIGGELPEYQVNVLPDKLREYSLAVDDVVEAARKAHSTASGGYLADVEGQELPIRQQARVRSLRDIANTVIRFHEGRAVTIGQVARVELAAAPQRGTAASSARPAVVLSIQKAPGTNTLALTRELDVAFAELEAALPKGMELDTHVFRQSDFIQLSLDNVQHVLRDASAIVAVILVLFLMNVRTTVITLVALPMSLAMAMIFLDLLGESINVMTLGGFAVAIGELVDDAIIDVENVFRRLRENAALPVGERRPFVRVVYDASNEIRSSVVFATVIIVLVFAPMMFLEGLEGRFFKPLGMAYISSLMASLLVALTLTPALCKLLLRRAGGDGHGEHDSGLVRLLKRAYRPTLAFALRWKVPVLAPSMAAAVGSLVVAGSFGTSFLPEFNEGTYTVFLLAPPGTSLAESDRLARGIEERLGRIEGVRHVARRTGRAERDQHAEPVSSSEIEVAVLPGQSREGVRKKIDAVLAQVPGITTMVGQPIEHRLSHILSGTPAAIAIDIYGEDLDTLRALAAQVKAVVEPIPGARDVNAAREVMVTTVPVRYRADDLARWGLTPDDAARQVQAAFAGEVVAEVNQGIRRYGLVVRLAPEARGDAARLEGLLLRGPEDALVHLGEVADVGLERASNLIARDQMRRKATVSCNVAAGANLGHLVAEVRAKVEPIVHAAGYRVHFGGQFEAQQAASKTLLWFGLATLGVMFGLLHVALGGVRPAALVLVNLPLAMIGGVVAVFLEAKAPLVPNALALVGLGDATYIAPVMSIASLVGFVTLTGIAVRNGILLVNHIQYLEDHESADVPTAIQRGAQERLRPSPMTPPPAPLGLVPLVLAAGQPGSELLSPLAVVVLGGLVSSTFLNLFVVPAGYALLFGRHPRRRASEGRDPERYLSEL